MRWKYWWLVGVVVVLCGCTSFDPATMCIGTFAEKKSVIEGTYLVSQEDYEAALDLQMEFDYQAWEAQTTPTSNETIENLTSSLELDPYYDEMLYVKRSNYYYALGEVEEAYADLRMANLIHPQTYFVFYSLGVEVVEADFSKIRRNLARCVRENPDDAQTVFEVGMYHYVMGEMEKAAGYFLQSLELDAMLHLSHYMIANIYNGLGDREMALTHIDQAIALHDVNPTYYELKATIAGYLGDTEMEVESYEMMLNTCNHPTVCERAYHLMKMTEPD